MGIRPILGHTTAPGVVQKLQRVLHVLVEQVVVLDHLGNALVLRQRHTQWTQAKTTLAAVLQQPQRYGRQQKALQNCRGQAGAACQIVQMGRGLVKGSKQIKPHTTEQHLAVHKTGHQIEQLAGTATRQPACEGIAKRPTVQTGMGIPTLQSGLPSVLERGRRVRGLHGGQIQGLGHGASFAS